MNDQVERILQAVSRHFGTTVERLVARDRHKSYVFARHIAMHIARETLQMSYPELGQAFGRDHTTVMSGIRSIKQNARAAAHIGAISEMLR